MKIEKLTKDQENYLVEFRDKWLKIGLCCEPANFEKAEEQITFFYEKLGKKKPMFFHFSSPMMCELGIAALIILLKDLAGYFENIPRKDEVSIYDLYKEMLLQIRGIHHLI